MGSGEVGELAFISFTKQLLGVAHEIADICMSGFKSTLCCFGRCATYRCLGDRCTCCYVPGQKNSTTCCLFICIVISLCSAIIAPVVLNALIDGGIDEAVVIDGTDAPSFSAWQSNIPGPDNDPVEVTYKLYFFDTQNADEVLQGARPVVLQRGPYSFREYYDKFNISFSDHGDTVTYSQQKYYIYDEENSAADVSLDDELVLPYPTALGFEFLFSGLNESMTFHSEQLDKDVTINDLLNLLVTYKFHDLIEALREAHRQCLADIHEHDCSAYADVIDNVQTAEQEVKNYLVDAPPFGTFLKLLLADNSNMGVSPFWKVKPVPAYFGWTSDPVLLAVNDLLALIEAKV